MELNRKPFQGIGNIIRFNWHFYLISFIFLACSLISMSFFSAIGQIIIIIIAVPTILTIIISFIVSYFIYDRSDLYKLNWLPKDKNLKILNISAGFDETSIILENKYPQSSIVIADFYDPLIHTEVSIKRARKAYPPHPKTIKVNTINLPFEDNSFDISLAILSAHEIRDNSERIQFIKELNRVTKLNGSIFITEHLRDLNNFLSYTIGFFHFHSRSKWLMNFKAANLDMKKEIKTTPFISTFKLTKRGDTP